MASTMTNSVANLHNHLLLNFKDAFLQSINNDSHGSEVLQ
jgi:hypothetical protein